MKTIAIVIIGYLFVAFYFALLNGYKAHKENPSADNEISTAVTCSLVGIFWPVVLFCAAVYWFGRLAMAVAKKISEVKK